MKRLIHILPLFKYAVLFLSLSITTYASSQEQLAAVGNNELLDKAQQAFNQGHHDVALNLWLALAQKGHSDAQVMLGLAYINSWGVKRNVKKAGRWYLQAATAGNLSAQFLLGLLYIQSDDKSEAYQGIMWLEQAAKNGDVESRQFLAKARKKHWFDHITKHMVRVEMGLNKDAIP